MEPAIDLALLHVYLSWMPPGLYHRRDDDPGGLYRDGSKCFDVIPNDPQVTGRLVSVLVYLLNHPALQDRGVMSKVSA